MNRLANIYSPTYDSKPDQPPDCGEESEADIAARESEVQDRVDTRLFKIKRLLRFGELNVPSPTLDVAQNEVCDFDDAARTAFIYYALDLDQDDLPQSVRLAAKEYVEQVRAVLTKIESEKP